MASPSDVRATQRNESLEIQTDDPPGMAIGLLDRRLVEALNYPAALKSALVDENPMTRQHRPWRRTPARGAATIGHIVIGMHSLKPMRRHAPWLNKPEFCEFFEHRSPPLPLCAAGR